MITSTLENVSDIGATSNQVPGVSGLTDRVQLIARTHDTPNPLRSLNSFCVRLSENPPGRDQCAGASTENDGV